MSTDALLAALEKLARLGNGDTCGNSLGNDIAIAALAAYNSAQPEQPANNAEPLAFLCSGELYHWPSEDEFCGNVEDHIPLYPALKPAIAQTVPPALETLTVDEIQECLNALFNHNGDDFEPKCSGCTAYQKLKAMGSKPVQPAVSAEGPKELWLQLHGECTDDERQEPVDYTDDGVTWCWHSIYDSDVRYVRADLAQPVQPANAKQETP